jgi:hypothetical protein
MSEALLQAYWLICLENESPEEGAASLTDAKMGNGKNGYSFGVKQFDLATNAEAGDVLAAVLAAGNGVDGVQIAAADLDAIRSGALALPVADIEDDPVLVALLARADAGLKRPGSHVELKRLTLAEMAKDVALVEEQLAGVSEAIGARAVMARGSFGALFLLDYENLYGSNIDKLSDFLAGGNVPLNGGLAFARSPDPFHLMQLLAYVLKTRQGSDTGQAGRSEILRRMNTVVTHASTADGGALPLGDADRAWLRDVLAPVIGGDANHWIRRYRDAGLYGALQKLTAAAP